MSAPTMAQLFRVTFTDTAARITTVAEALAQAGDLRRRTAVAASAELEAERQAGRDVRSGAVRIVRLLAEADALESYSAKLSAGVAHPGDVPLPLDPEAVATSMDGDLARALADISAAAGAAGRVAPVLPQAPAEVNGRPAWTAPELYEPDDDDESLPNGEDAALAADPALAIELDLGTP